MKMNKKIIIIFLIFLICLDANAKKKKFTTAEHPIEYILDLSDVGNFKFEDNTFYGDKGETTRQICLNFTKFIRLNKPEIGDTIRITGILISPIDIDNLIVGLVDDSISANYWLNLSKDGSSVKEQRNFADFSVSNIKAKKPFYLDVSLPIKHKMKLRFTVQLAYGEQNGKPCKMKVQRLCNSYYGIYKVEEGK